MTTDPSFGLVIATPLALIAIVASLAARPKLRTAAIMGACTLIAFIVGCGKPETSQPTTGSQPPPVSAPAPAAHIKHSNFSASAAKKARTAKAGLVAVDIFDTRTDGGPNSAGITLTSGQELHVIGWGYLPEIHQPCSEIGLLVDGTHVFPGDYGYVRPDVAAFYHDPARTSVGYGIVVRYVQLGRGSHTANVVCLGPSGQAARNAAPLRVSVQ